MQAVETGFDTHLWSRVRVVEGLDGSQPREALLDALRELPGRPCPDWVITNLSDPVLFRRPGTGEPFSGKLGTLPVPYNKRWYTQPQTIGSVACGVSHHMVWSKIAQGSEPWAVVLEDDQALPSAEAFDAFAREVEELGAWDIVYLFKMPAAILDEAPGGTPRLRPLRWQFGAQAYALSRRFARTLVGLRLPRCLTVPDEFMNWAYNPYGHPRREQWESCFGRPPAGRRAFVYVGTEPLVRHLKLPSDLELKDPEKDAEAKAVVAWLEARLQSAGIAGAVEMESHVPTFGYAWAAAIASTSVIVAAGLKAWRRGKCRRQLVSIWRHSHGDGHDA